MIVDAISINYLPAVNFALQQNHVPIIRELIVTNNSDREWTNLVIEIRTEPDFAESWQQHIDSLAAGESLSLKSLPLIISARYLASLSEKLAGHFRITLVSEGIRLQEASFPVDILAYDQWAGLALMPETLAAFITPNHPEIPFIIRRASAILQKWTASPSFDEYQTRNPDRVRKQMAAIYEAIAEMQLIYCSVPASFEESGQRVRLADDIFKNRLANCLDLSLLFAACLEAVGIHSLIVIIKGHAFAGAWLTDETFADPVNDDPSLITKRTAEGIHDIAIVESTCMNAGHQSGFDEAARLADEKMYKVEEFSLFIDVRRARFAGIRPLPLRHLTAAGWEISEDEAITRGEELPAEIVAGAKLTNVAQIDVTKQRLWERKLLDLSLRNSLLNLRITKSLIQFMISNVPALEDALANGDEFQIVARPTDWENGLRDAGLYQALHKSDPLTSLLNHELTQKRIRSFLPEAELIAALTTAYRNSRLSLEENGANTLYVALGLLKWYETAVSEKPKYAPILLIPVEIIRKTSQRGFVIRSREEETIVNITMLEMLRHDFGINIGGLDALPKDKNGVDVRAVLNTVRQAVMAKSRWDVEEQGLLGNFSFSKFILWNDIHNNADELAKNKVVASLLSGKLEWKADDNVAVSEIMDAKLHPSKIALPISTDSSQLQAIVSSSEGRSFVLHGPPGTGKSQTITNIIANALYSGKRVLFVAAKKAALDVVESRLESIGIGSFCLELHSNKSKKSAVLDQLREATQVANRMAPENFMQEADRLFALRNELNIYVEALHKKYPFGYSLFEIFEQYGRLPGGESKVYFSANALGRASTASVANWDDLASQLQTVGSLVKQPKEHALSALNPIEYNSDLKSATETSLGEYSQLAATLSLQNVSEILKLSASVQDRSQEETQVKLLRLFLLLEDIPGTMMSMDAPEQTIVQIQSVAKHGISLKEQEAALLQKFRKDILSFPASELLAEWNQASNSWFIPKIFKQKKLRKQLGDISLNGGIENEEVPQILLRVINFQEEQDELNKSASLKSVLGYLWGNWVLVQNVCEQLLLINRVAATLKTGQSLRKWRVDLAAEFSEGSRAYFNFHQTLVDNYLNRFAQIQRLENNLKQIAGIDFDTLYKTGSDWKTIARESSAGWLKNINQLKDWFNWIRVRKVAMDAGLEPLVSAFENALFDNTAIVAQYRKGFLKSAAEYIIGNNPQLASFSGTIFNDRIKRFRELSKQFETLTRQELYARLAAKTPSFTQEASQSSEIGILQRALRSNARGMSIRKLFDSIPNLLSRLTPCMLMSPISVAQYFEADGEKFDLVIFDEASQMPTCEAVGAISRGKNVIVVGDPKQMPPTNFFSTNNIDEDNLEKEDLESILDDCLALSMPSQYLLWHYRSRHESLIAFSNAKFYDNKLLTFPSTDDITSKVQFVQVPGFYDIGKTRQNKFEAQAIVDEIIFRLADPVLQTRSIGVVTFSSVQQILIEDMLTEIFASRPDLEKKALEAKESLFIKNLENVQGDERDVILFSVCYGPDEAGKVSLNFGPINREGGWRRLNVAVSRARYEMKVFSTLRSDQINLNRTGSEGVAGLKAFLAYAEKGKQVLPLPSVKKQGEAGFEEVIAAGIRKMGYEVHTHIGCSDYRIDIAVVDRINSSRYLLGVLTDGRNYLQANTSKDREIIQMEVLSALGWTIHKVWSTEWWEFPEKVISELQQAIRQAEEVVLPLPEEISKPVELDVGADSGALPALAGMGGSSDLNGVNSAVRILSGGDASVSVNRDAAVNRASGNEFNDLDTNATDAGTHPGLESARGGSNDAFTSGAAATPAAVSSAIKPEATAMTAADGSVRPTAAIPYEICKLEPVRSKLSDDFLLPQNQMLINSQILKVLSVESPISKNLLCRRVLSAWNIGRMGSRIQNYFPVLFSNAGIKSVAAGGNEFFWKHPELISGYTSFRTAKSDDQKRDVEDLPPDEIANAVSEILQNQISLLKNDLVRETARIFGFTRIGGNVELTMHFAIELAIQKGFAKLEGERVATR